MITSTARNQQRKGDCNGKSYAFPVRPQIHIKVNLEYKRCFVCNKVIPWTSFRKMFCVNKCSYTFYARAKYSRTGKYTYRGRGEGQTLKLRTPYHPHNYLGSKCVTCGVVRGKKVISYKNIDKTVRDLEQLEREREQEKLSD